jgi:phosphatidate cytidylyltransferase
VTTPAPSADPFAPAKPAALGTFASRATVAAIVLSVFAALAWADASGLGGAGPAWWLLPVAVVLAVGGANELVHLLAGRGLAVRGLLVRVATVAIVLSAALGSQASAAAAQPVAALGIVATACMATLAAFFLAEIILYRPQDGALERLAAGALTAIGLGLPLAFIVALRLLRVDNQGPQHGASPQGMLPLVSLVAVVKAGDIAAYLVGSLIGRHRMVPALSPGKTWEGAAAALAGSLAAAWLVLEGCGWQTQARPWGGWATFGLVVGLAGMAGDLAESLVKRELGAKDSGRSLGGLGGVLDLVDSLLLAAPVAWALWALG